MALRERLRLGGRLGKRGVVVLVVALVAVIGVGGWLMTRQGAAAAPQTITSTIASGTVQTTVSATGTLEPLHQADQLFAVGGTVTSVRVAAGDTVRKGQVLATLDRTSLRAAVTSADAQLDAAQAQYDDDSASDASDTQLAADSASVAAAESSLSQAEDDLESGVLRSTLRGTIASVDLEVGDTVSGSSSSSAQSSSSQSSQGQGTQLPSSSSSTSSQSASSTSTSTTAQVVVVSPRLFTVSAAVSADDVASVKKGMQATVTPAGSSANVFGTVTSVGLVAETSSSGAATFPVTVTLTGPQKDVYAGTTATVAIITKQQSDVLTVPTAALHGSGTSTYVTKQVGSETVKQTVKLGAAYGASTVVTSGLKTGDKVVVVTLRVPAGGGTTGNNRGGTGQLPGGGNGPPGGFGGSFGGGAP